MDLVIATRNAGKIKEIKALLAHGDFCVHSLEEFPDLKEVEEDGETFAANALKKARAVLLAEGRRKDLDVAPGVAHVGQHRLVLAVDDPAPPSQLGFAIEAVRPGPGE